MMGYLEDYGDYGDYYFDDYYYPEYAYDDYGNIGGGYTPGVDEIPYAPYEPMDLAPYDPSLPDLPTFGNDIWYTPPEYTNDPYSQFFDWQGPIDYFAEPLENIITQEQGLPPISNIDWSFPYQNYLPTFETPPYTPYEAPAPAPPELPQSPATQQQNLPPACPAGQYHPYPIGHPGQNVCVPFPAQQTQQPAKPQPQSGSGSSSGGSSGGSKPPAQQQQNCPTGYCKHPQTGQCIPTPAGYQRDPQSQVCKPLPQQQQQQCAPGTYRNPSTGQCVTVPNCPTPGTVFDGRTGRCVPYAQAQQPLCPTGYWPNFNTKRCEPIPQCQPGMVFDQTTGRCVLPSQVTPGEGDIFGDLKNIPWWAWAVLGGLFFLTRDDEGGKKTTVTYRRATA